MMNSIQNKTINNSSKASRTKIKNMNGITIINNNVNNFYQQALEKQLSRENSCQNQMRGHWWKRSPSPGQKHQSNKPVHQQSFPSFLSIRNKVHSVHSNNISYQHLAQPRESKESQYSSFNSQHQRKKEKIFTFSRNGKDQQTKNVFY